MTDSGLRSRLRGKTWRATQRLKQAFGLAQTIEYRCGDYPIRLPAGHLLPDFQRQHPLYDRFLPHLSRYLDAGLSVIDVGANCGDTLAAMYSANPALKFICIEPDDSFFGFLQVNAAKISASGKNASITLVKSLVGKTVTSAVLEGSGGTKYAVIRDSGPVMTARTLDSIVADMPIGKLGLLKCDVDGFDYDVIDSALETLKRFAPLVFFECHFVHPFQKTGFENTVAGLRELGYCKWAIFDGFGNLILTTGDAGQILQLIGYVWRQKQQGGKRTINYFDILAATPGNAGLLEQATGDYVSRS